MYAVQDSPIGASPQLDLVTTASGKLPTSLTDIRSHGNAPKLLYSLLVNVWKSSLLNCTTVKSRLTTDIREAICEIRQYFLGSIDYLVCMTVVHLPLSMTPVIYHGRADLSAGRRVSGTDRSCSPGSPCYAYGPITSYDLSAYM